MTVQFTLQTVDFMHDASCIRSTPHTLQSEIENLMEKTVDGNYDGWENPGSQY